jgi:hypothetical protein
METVAPGETLRSRNPLGVWRSEHGLSLRGRAGAGRPRDLGKWTLRYHFT